MTWGATFAQDINDRLRMLVNLTDYIAKDYAMAVSSNGEIISEFEYAEMTGFGEDALNFSQQIKIQKALPQADSLVGLSIALKAAIDGRKPADSVAQIAKSIKHLLLSANLIAQAPSHTPDWANGKNVYRTHCASCHGMWGGGDGPQAKGLQPQPAAFNTNETMGDVSPFQVFNTALLGIPGTPMASFKHLGEEQLWDVAFYILSIRYGNERMREVAPAPIEKLATMTDRELAEKYGNENLAAARLGKWETGNDQRVGLDLAADLIGQSSELAISHQWESAHNMALRAYLDYIEPVEPRIMAKDNALFGELEQTMLNFRSVIKSRGGEREVLAARDAALEKISQAKSLLNTGNQSTFSIALVSATILLREGLEAVFIILAILSVLKAMNVPEARKWIHGGWIAAVLFGFATWFFADSLVELGADRRELMEGVIAILAVGVLIYLGYWLHGKSEATRWKEFVQNRIQSLISTNNMIGLGVFAFIVVFREAFESVLFLSSLALSGAESAGNGILLGTIGAGVAVAGISVAMLKWFDRLPVHKVFQYSTYVILALAFVLAGQGIHSLQEGGFFSITPFPVNIRISLLGIYPTFESILIQAGVLALIVTLGMYRPGSHKAAK
ncbi:MAG: cytochrome c/FTR1 family iron permease [Salibacteraceae bacterium]